MLFCEINCWWEFCLIMLFLLSIMSLFICVIVDKWCVIVIIVLFVIKLFKLVWIVVFIFELRVLVVLFNIKIGVFFRRIWVIVICCCWLFESFIFCLLICVVKFLLFLLFFKFLMNLSVLVCFVVVSIFFLVVFGLL